MKISGKTGENLKSVQKSENNHHRDTHCGLWTASTTQGQVPSPAYLGERLQDLKVPLAAQTIKGWFVNFIRTFLLQANWKPSTIQSCQIIGALATVSFISQWYSTSSYLLRPRLPLQPHLTAQSSLRFLVPKPLKD